MLDEKQDCCLMIDKCYFSVVSMLSDLSYLEDSLFRLIYSKTSSDFYLDHRMYIIKSEDDKSSANSIEDPFEYVFYYEDEDYNHKKKPIMVKKIIIQKSEESCNSSSIKLRIEEEHTLLGNKSKSYSIIIEVKRILSEGCLVYLEISCDLNLNQNHSILFDANLIKTLEQYLNKDINSKCKNLNICGILEINKNNLFDYICSLNFMKKNYDKISIIMNNEESISKKNDLVSLIFNSKSIILQCFAYIDRSDQSSLKFKFLDKHEDESPVFIIECTYINQSKSFLTIKWLNRKEIPSVYITKFTQIAAFYVNKIRNNIRNLTIKYQEI